LGHIVNPSIPRDKSFADEPTPLDYVFAYDFGTPKSNEGLHSPIRLNATKNVADVLDGVRLDDIPVVYAYEVGNEESKRVALQKQKEYYETLEKRSVAGAKKTTRSKSLPADTSSVSMEGVTKKRKASMTPAKPEKVTSSTTSSKKPKNVEPFSVSSNKTMKEWYPIREPAPEDFLVGKGEWIREIHNRKNDPKHFDKYWFTPKANLRLRSIPEVKRFLELLDEMHGDEAAVFEKIKRR
jgi:hypothetical protein